MLVFGSVRRLFLTINLCFFSFFSFSLRSLRFRLIVPVKHDLNSHSFLDIYHTNASWPDTSQSKPKAMPCREFSRNMQTNPVCGALALR